MPNCKLCGKPIIENVVEHHGDYYCRECFDGNFTLCHNCTEIISISEMKVSSDGREFCPVCYSNLFGTCTDCGVEIPVADLESYGGNAYCHECYNDLFTTCNSCGRTMAKIDSHTSDDDDDYCFDCYNRKFTRCYSCEREVPINDSFRFGSHRYCESCFDDEFTDCDDCGSTIRRDDAYCQNDRTVCSDCYSNMSEYIHEHHEWDGRLLFYDDRGICERGEQDNVLYLGVELETDNYGDKHQAAERLYDLSCGEDKFHLEEDGSLDDGIEIITQPATLKYHKENIGWDRITRAVLGNGGKSHDTSTCGLHIHFNSSYFGSRYDECVLKLLYLVERFWFKFVKFSRRSEYTLDKWAKRYGDDGFDKYITREQQHRKVDSTKRMGRYFAVNIENSNTVEIRMFRGTLKVSTIIASLQFVDFLVRFINEATIEDLQYITWNSLMARIKTDSYPELVDYLLSKELISAVQIPLGEQSNLNLNWERVRLPDEDYVAERS